MGNDNDSAGADRPAAVGEHEHSGKCFMVGGLVANKPQCQFDDYDESHLPNYQCSMGITHNVTPAAAPVVGTYVDVLFDGGPGPEGGRFIECEDVNGNGVLAGEWIDCGNGQWKLRIQTARAPTPNVEELSREIASELRTIIVAVTEANRITMPIRQEDHSAAAQAFAVIRGAASHAAILTSKLGGTR